MEYIQSWSVYTCLTHETPHARFPFLLCAMTPACAMTWTIRECPCCIAHCNIKTYIYIHAGRRRSFRRRINYSKLPCTHATTVRNSWPSRPHARTPTDLKWSLRHKEQHQPVESSVCSRFVSLRVNTKLIEAVGPPEPKHSLARACENITRSHALENLPFRSRLRVVVPGRKTIT